MTKIRCLKSTSKTLRFWTLGICLFFQCFFSCNLNFLSTTHADDDKKLKTSNVKLQKEKKGTLTLLQVANMRINKSKS